MVQFPVNWTIDIHKVYGTIYHYLSELKLDKEWKLVCLSRRNPGEYLKPDFVQIQRVSATEDVSVSGSLYLRNTADQGSFIKGESAKIGEEMSAVHNFSKFMESGSSSVVVDFRDATSGVKFLNYSLEGVVNITHASSLENAECRKCADMTPLEELSNDLGRLLDAKTCCFSDVELICEDGSLPAHKNILSVRSPFFAAMFGNPVRESRGNEGVICDVGVSVLRKMLDFVYTGQLSDLNVSLASDLLLLADLYLMPELKRRCCDLLHDAISLQNMLRIFLLGEKHCSDLKNRAMDYICNSCKDFAALEKTEDWKTMKTDRPDLVMEILSSMVKAKEKN